MAKHRAHSIKFKRDVAPDFLGGGSPRALVKHHGISGNRLKSESPSTRLPGSIVTRLLWMHDAAGTAVD